MERSRKTEWGNGALGSAHLLKRKLAADYFGGPNTRGKNPGKRKRGDPL